MKRLFKRMDKPLLIVMFVFLIFGLVMVLSASSMESFMRYNSSPYNYFLKQGLFIITGLIIFMVVIKIPTNYYRKLSVLLITLSIFFLGGLMIYGYAANNAQSWINFRFVNLQPSEFAKIALILYIASYYEKHIHDLDNILTLIFPLIVSGIIFALIALQPDFGTASIIIAIALLMFYAVPMEKGTRKLINRLLLAGIALIVLIFVTFGGTILKSYQLDRFKFWSPCERYKDDTGYQVCNSLIAFNNGGLTGQGIGESTQKYLYLPESYTDFIFPIIVEEWGVIVGAIIIILYGFILWRIFMVAKTASNLKGSLIAFGVFIYLLLHITINLVGVTALGPLTGVPLPFLSYGGSYMWSLLIAMGLVQRVKIESNLKKTH